MTTTVRIIANMLMAILLLYLANRYLMFWHGWPGPTDALAQLTSTGEDGTPANWQGIAVILSYLALFVLIIWQALRTGSQSLLIEADRYAGWSAYVIRFAFWSVFLVGIVDTVISALIIEKVLQNYTGDALAASLGQSRFRGLYVHYPLIAVAAVIAGLTRNLSMIWLAFLVVVAEFAIVITRFVFSYEQAYMGDLVRFWYAALFLFASAYTLVEDGHVRVDIFYANMGIRKKAWVNTCGSLLLGVPLCSTILWLGLDSRQSSLASPILSFEISQSAYGLFVKYLMAGFLIIFAVSMFMQFISFYLRNTAVLLRDQAAVAVAKGEH